MSIPSENYVLRKCILSFISELPVSATSNSHSGDHYFDAIALDFYSKTMYTRDKYEVIRKIAGDKPMAIGECEVIPGPEIIHEQPDWTFFMAWADLIFKENKTDDIINLYNDPGVLTLDEMPGWI